MRFYALSANVILLHGNVCSVAFLHACILTTVYQQIYAYLPLDTISFVCRFTNTEIKEKFRT